MNPVMVSTTERMHAHKCAVCAEKGKEVIWIHPDADRGQVASHRCPECGTVNWKQCLVENGKLPAPLPKNYTPGMNFETILGYAVTLILLSLLGYGVYWYVQYRRGQKAEIA